MPAKTEIKAKSSEHVSSRDASPGYKGLRNLFFRTGDKQPESTREVTRSENNNLFTQRYPGKGQTMLLVW